MHTFCKRARNVQIRFHLTQNACHAILLLLHRNFLLKSVVYDYARPQFFSHVARDLPTHSLIIHPLLDVLTYYSSAYDLSFIKPESIYPQLDIDRPPRDL